jgi:FG-GAP-like repeat
MTTTRSIGKLAVSLCCCLMAITSTKAQSPRFFGSSFFETSTYVDAVVVADFTGDGIPDIASCNGFDPGEANILLSNGDGTFGEAQRYDLAGANPVTIAAGDLIVTASSIWLLPIAVMISVSTIPMPVFPAASAWASYSVTVMGLFRTAACSGRTGRGPRPTR